MNRRVAFASLTISPMGREALSLLTTVIAQRNYTIVERNTHLWTFKKLNCTENCINQARIAPTERRIAAQTYFINLARLIDNSLVTLYNLIICFVK